MAGISSVVRNGIMTNSQYRLIHLWVETKMGKPMWCWNCRTRTGKHYEWANKSGEYKKDIFDWIRLCKKCHVARDRPREFCNRGHKLEGDNLGYKFMKGSMSRYCRTCNKETSLRHYYAKQEANHKQELK